MAARAAFDYFAERLYNSRRTTVDRLLGALRSGDRDITRADLIELFRELEAAGCGVFRIGRRGKPTRFEWGVSLIAVGRSARGESVTVEPIGEADSVEPEEADSEEDLPSIEMLEHRYRLRSDVELKLELPLNLSVAEAARIADYVRTLPFA